MANSALIEDLEKQFGENPRRVFARLANEYRKAGDLERAIDICRAHVPLQPTYISGYIVLGQALFESGRLDEARVTFETALGLDPENLIGLRQLGDIARAAGDVERARAWYNRLLEVDPQNDEIVAQLSALEAPAHPAPYAAAAQEPVRWSDIHPEEQPASDDSSPHTAADAFVPDAIGAALEQATAFEQGALATSDAVAEHEPLEIELNGDFLHPAEAYAGDAHSGDAEVGNHGLETLGPGVEFDELSSVQAASHVEEPPLAGVELSLTIAAEAAGAEDHGTELSAAPELELGGAFQLSRVEESPTAEALAVGEAPAGEVEAADQPGLFGAPANNEAAADHGLPSAPSDVPQRTPDFETFGVEEVSLESLSRAFVTETMAELYRRQGFPEEALAIYRQLAAQRPDDAELRKRLARLELELTPSRREQWAAQSLEVPGETAAPRERPSVTIRSLFASIADRRAPAASALETPAHESTEVDPRADVNRGGDPTGAFGELFEGGSVAPGDDRAATALAGAFSPEFSGSPSAAPGEPTRAAFDELSLDDVFGGERAQGEQRGRSPNVSFDEFFGGEHGVRRAEEQSDRSPGDSDSQEGGSSDLELFHAWLEGLKK